jgi:hypothetical protein
MRIITKQDVQELVTAGSTVPAVTLYAPMHSTASPQHLSEDQTRLKNLIGTASSELARQYGKDHPLIAELSAWYDTYHDDLSFWDNQTAGLLICAKQGACQWFNLPVETDEYVSVDDTFHLAPVLAMLAQDHDYYVLTVNQHDPKLFKGNSYNLHMATVELPHSIQSALGIDENRQKGENQGSVSGSGQGGSSFNGRGGGHNPQDQDRLKFFRIIDHAINAEQTHELPLILAGTISETSEYRSISKYPRLMHATINGSHADNDMENLHRQAIAIIDTELVQPAYQAALTEYRQLEGADPDRVAGDVESIAVATREGRVGTLLASMTTQTSDNVQDGLTSQTKISLPSGEKGKLLNKLALKVWQARGTIINLKSQDMPDGVAMVAQLRY